MAGQDSNNIELIKSKIAECIKEGDELRRVSQLSRFGGDTRLALRMMKQWNTKNITYLDKYVRSKSLRSNYNKSIPLIHERMWGWADKVTAWTLDRLCELQTISDLLDTAHFDEAGDPGGDTSPLPKRSTTPVAPPTRVFIVHGRDSGRKSEVARFLDKIGCEPIILHERPEKGIQTVIDKFEEHADVHAAVVLLTADDRGRLASHALDQEVPRARQNVWLEFGYFLGKLTPARVFAFKDPDVEIPSDMGGVIIESFDVGGAWRLMLARNLRSAGFRVNSEAVVDQ